MQPSNLKIEPDTADNPDSHCRDLITLMLSNGSRFMRLTD
jgi:hypothetical protein